MDLASRAASVGTLAEPTRRALYEYVVASREPVGREQAASALGLAPHTAAFHLDKLVDAGLLSTEFRRLGGRSGPGAGRPSKLYRRADAELTVSLPDRHYDLVGHILASGVDRAREGTPLEQAIDEAASEAGRAIGSEAAPGDSSAFVDLLGDHGFEPRVTDDTVLLANCPFDTLAASHGRLVCGLNRSFVQGIADGVGCDAEARLEPEPGHCCVKARLNR